MQLDELILRYPALAGCKNDIEKLFSALVRCFEEGETLYLCGNGGSCADAEHIVGELMKGFKKERRCDASFAAALRAADPERAEVLIPRLQGGLRAVALSSHPSLITAYLNDIEGGSELAFAQQLYGYGKRGDALLGISTSGNSKNVLYAATVARALGMKVLALTGETGGELARFADIAVKVPETDTYKVQELHLPVYHCLCLMLEEHFFG